jgi:hypothetical protein
MAQRVPLAFRDVDDFQRFVLDLARMMDGAAGAAWATGSSVTFYPEHIKQPLGFLL